MVDIIEISKQSPTASFPPTNATNMNSTKTDNISSNSNNTNYSSSSHARALTPTRVMNPYSIKKKRTLLVPFSKSSKRQTTDHNTESRDLCHSSDSSNHYVDLTLSPEKCAGSQVEVVKPGEQQRRQRQRRLQEAAVCAIKKINKQCCLNDSDDDHDDCLSSSSSDSNSDCSDELSGVSSKSSTSSSSFSPTKTHDNTYENNKDIKAIGDGSGNDDGNVNGNGDYNNSSSNPLKPSTSLPKRSTPIIDPSLYKPPTYQDDKPDPIIHSYTLQSRPVSSRQMVPVSKVFQKPISNFWNEKWHSFNHMQTELSQALVYSDDNMVVSAPTGAG